MPQLILIIIGIAIGALLFRRKTRPLLRARLRQGKDKIVGICAAAVGRDAKKRENLEKIVELLTSRGTASNADIRKALGVSAASVTRYLDELEKEGKVRQIGDAGHAVVYRLK